MTASVYISCLLILLGVLGGWCCIVMAGRMSEEARKANPDEDAP